jgi:hypothetical protein
MKLTTSLNLLKKVGACSDGLETLLKHIGQRYDPGTPINLLTILESNGVDHFFWSFRALEQDWKDARPILISIVTDIAESVLHIFEEKYPADDRPRKAIEAAKTETDLEKLQEAAAAAAFAARAEASAASAAWAAKYAASAAWAEYAKYAASDTEWATYAADAAAAAERRKQIEIIKKYLTWE